MTRQSKWLIGTELILSGLIILTLIWQRDSGWDAIGIAFIYRPTLQTVLIVVLIFHIISTFKKRNNSIVHFLLKLIYLLVVILVLVSTFLLPNEYMYAREIIDFTLNKQWFEEVAIIAPNLSHCSIPIEFGCWEIIELPEENRRENYVVKVAAYKQRLGIIVDKRQYVSYVRLTGQTGLPQVSFGNYEAGCVYKLSEDWYVCGIGR